MALRSRVKLSQLAWSTRGDGNGCLDRGEELKMEREPCTISCLEKQGSGEGLWGLERSKVLGLSRSSSDSTSG